jgi:prevent-host-death family protein
MLTKIPKIIQVSEFRKNLAGYLRQAKQGPVVISAERGGDNRVILSAETYNKLIGTYEDRVDSQELTRLVNEDKGKSISWKDLRIKTSVHAI